MYSCVPDCWHSGFNQLQMLAVNSSQPSGDIGCMPALFCSRLKTQVFSCSFPDFPQHLRSDFVSLSDT